MKRAVDVGACPAEGGMRRVHIDLTLCRPLVLARVREAFDVSAWIDWEEIEVTRKADGDAGARATVFAAEGDEIGEVVHEPETLGIEEACLERERIWKMKEDMEEHGDWSDEEIEEAQIDLSRRALAAIRDRFRGEPWQLALVVLQAWEEKAAWERTAADIKAGLAT